MPKPKGVREIVEKIVDRTIVNLNLGYNRKNILEECLPQALTELQELIDKKIDEMPLYGDLYGIENNLIIKPQLQQSIAELFGKGK